MLGMDTSKDKLAISLLDPGTKKLVWQEEVPNSASGLQRLHERTPPECAWVVAPTGRYSEPVVDFGYSVGRKVLLAQPTRANSFLRSVQFRAKTERLDSVGLALYGLSRGTLGGVWPENVPPVNT